MRYGELEKSPFMYKLRPNLTLYFSTEKNLDRFCANLESSRYALRNRFRVRHGVYGNTDLTSDISLYIKIEKVGFCIKLNGDIIKCQDEVILNGDQLMKNGCKTLSEISTEKLTDWQDGTPLY